MRDAIIDCARLVIKRAVGGEAAGAGYCPGLVPGQLQPLRFPGPATVPVSNVTDLMGVVRIGRLE